MHAFRRIGCWLTTVIAVMGIGRSVQGASLPVDNADFEKVPVATGGYTYTLDAWQTSNEGGGPPPWISNGYYPDESTPPSPAIYSTGDDVYQVLSGTFTEGTTYTFVMDVGSRAAGATGGGVPTTDYIWRLFFYNATDGDRTAPLAEATGTVTATPAGGDLWNIGAAVVQYTATAADDGDVIGIGLGGVVTSYYTLYDNASVESGIARGLAVTEHGFETTGTGTDRFWLVWTSGTGQTYTVETVGDLTGDWLPVATNLPGQDGVTAYSNPVPPHVRTEHYRVMQEPPPQPPRWEGGEITVLSWNVWIADANTAKITAVVAAAGADIIGFQELSNPGLVVSALESATGEDWHLLSQSSGDTQVISRFPIVGGNAWGAEIQLAPGSTAWIFNVHLAAYPYQPYDLRDGTLAMNEAAVIAAANSARGVQVDNLVSAIRASGALPANLPVFVTGDFNEPSHLDWTQAAADATSRPYDLKVAYPASLKVVNEGFTDAFRRIRPDEINDPAYTWTPGAPPPDLSADEVHDRIDFVYFGPGPGPTVTGAATIALDAGNLNTDIGIPGYPADHRAVAATFQVPAYP